MKVSLIVPTRNKVKWVERAALSYVRQLPGAFELEIVFFDQASTDGTLEILQDLAEKYDGPHKVRVLNCPPTERGGTAPGMNADINWVHGQIGGDVILWGNADDFAYQSRTLKTVDAFAQSNASWVSVGQYYMSEDLRIEGETYFPDKRTRRIEFAEAVQWQIGSSGALAYARDLWDKYQPMRGIEQNDIVLPLMSFLERGMVYVNEPLQVYVKHADLNNQGINGQMMASRTQQERWQLEEVNAFNLAANWMAVSQRMNESGKTIPQDAASQINNYLMTSCKSFIEARQRLTIERIAPRGMHMKALNG